VSAEPTVQKNSRFLGQAVTEATWCESPGFCEKLFLVRGGSGVGPLDLGDIRIGGSAHGEGKLSVRIEPSAISKGAEVCHGTGEFIQSIPDAADRPGTSVSGPDLQC